MNAVKLFVEWTPLFNNTLRKLELEDLVQQDDNDVEIDDTFDEDKDVAKVRQARSRSDWPHAIQFSWDLAEEEEPQGSPSPAHQAALEILRIACNKHSAWLWTQEEAHRKIKDLLSSQATEFSVFEQLMGCIDYLVAKHGSVANAVEQALAGGKTNDVAAITNQLVQFQEDLKDAVAESETSKNTLLQLLLKVRKSGSCWYKLNKCLRSVKSMQSSQPSQGASRPGASAILLPPGITADMVFGIGQFGGVGFELSISSLFGLVWSLEAKVQVLSDHTKNTGVQFGDLAFASKSKFGNAY